MTFASLASWWRNISQRHPEVIAGWRVAIDPVPPTDFVGPWTFLDIVADGLQRPGGRNMHLGSVRGANCKADQEYFFT